MARDSSRRRGRQRRRLLAVEQLVIAEDDDSDCACGRVPLCGGSSEHQAKAGAERNPHLANERSRPDWASLPGARTSPRRFFSASLWQAMSTRSSAATASSSSRTLVTSPLKRSTDSTRRWHVASTLGVGSADSATLGNCTSCLKTPATENRPVDVGDAFEVVLALLFQVAAFDEDRPRARVGR